MDIQSKARDIIRYEEIIDIEDYENKDGCYRVYYMVTEKDEFYKIVMHNGRVIELSQF